MQLPGTVSASRLTANKPQFQKGEKTMYRIKTEINLAVSEVTSNASLKDCYKTGARLVRFGKRYKILVRFNVYSLDGERLLGFYGRKSIGRDGYTARLTFSCRYGKRCNGITF